MCLQKSTDNVIIIGGVLSDGAYREKTAKKAS